MIIRSHQPYDLLTKPLSPTSAVSIWQTFEISQKYLPRLLDMQPEDAVSRQYSWMNASLKNRAGNLSWICAVVLECDTRICLESNVNFSKCNNLFHGWSCSACDHKSYINTTGSLDLSSISEDSGWSALLEETALDKDSKADMQVVPCYLNGTGWQQHSKFSCELRPKHTSVFCDASTVLNNRSFHWMLLLQTWLHYLHFVGTV